MKSVRFFLIALLLNGLSSWALVLHAAMPEFEYISPIKRLELVQAFAKATNVSLIQLQNKWQCDMYGMRTRLQVKRAVMLYDFVTTPLSVDNSGDNPIKRYYFSEGVLVGEKDLLRDEIRLKANGDLISRLSTNEPDRVTLAYSVCKLADSATNL